jgi:hypothetical protein
VRLLVRLHVVESLHHNLHLIVLSGNQLLKVDGVIGVGMVGLAVAHIVPCVHHLTAQSRTNIRFYGNPNYMPQGIWNMMPFIYFVKDEVMDRAPKRPTTPIKHT